MANGTKQFEEDVASALEYGKQALAEAAQLFAPVPLDSQAVSTGDQHFDWQNRGPDYWQKLLGNALFQATSSGGNTGDALIALLKQDKKMQEYKQ